MISRWNTLSGPFHYATPRQPDSRPALSLPEDAMGARQSWLRLSAWCSLLRLNILPSNIGPNLEEGGRGRWEFAVFFRLYRC